ncbi:hypothetical protein E4U35_003284 [Claviceps purpurea]|nr:hypothetical protein E4U35_003284 [Claviceps purpurea]
MPPAMEEHEDVRRYQAPYGAHRPIPTISKYREAKAARQQEAIKTEQEKTVDADERENHEAKDQERQQQISGEASQGDANDTDLMSADKNPNSSPQNGLEDTSQVDPGSTDVRQRRKDLKHKKRERAEREVTDPVTHLPVKIHDFTDDALKEAASSHPAFTSHLLRGNSGPQDGEGSETHLENETSDLQRHHDTMQSRFPPPDFDNLKRSLTTINSRGLTLGLVGILVIGMLGFPVGSSSHRNSQGDSRGTSTTAADWLPTLFSVSLVLCAAGAVIAGVRQYTARKISNIFEDEVWEAHRQQAKTKASHHEAETTIWLNSVLAAVWPLINPDLFATLSDTLEDVMQASLPKLVRMVSVDDIGQGSESIRILGIQWLPTGAASKSVTEDGKLASKDEDAHSKKGQASLTSSPESGPDDNPLQEGSKGVSKVDAAAQGMQGEEGDFVNIEVAFAYRTRSSSRGLKDRSKDMHLYLAFYLPGNVKIPVWVDLQGIIGSVRLRLQLCPDPPFFSLCTLTLMGQPKVDVRCVPLSRRGLNIMDVPLISHFVQSAVDAAVAEYVAPKSLTLNLKDMLAGDDFKKDTLSIGVIMIHISRGYEFKMGDTAIPLIKDGSSDPYVSVAWAKFGKVLWSSRIMQSEMEPHWGETCFVLVTPEEVNIGERIRVQLWDSDRFTADDDLGRIEVSLADLMQNEASKEKMSNRTDGFRALKAGDGMPGKLQWSVGYFPKARIQPNQFAQQTHDPKVRSMDQLKAKVEDTCERKLREFMIKEDVKARDEEELGQQMMQEMKDETDAMIISAPPPDEYPSGLFSIQIHNITGLAIERLNKRQVDEYDEASDEEEEGDSLPSSFCTIIINHGKTFKTRTKPHNSKPFFNAGCERFIRDWKSCEVFVSVRDARLHEDNPLLGIVHLPLADLFKDRTQVMGWYPLSGGIGRGRVRLSMVWRSVVLQAPRNLLGWHYGTISVGHEAFSRDCPSELKSCKLKLKTDICMGKMYCTSSDNDQQEAKWTAKKEHNLHLAVRKRYSSCLAVEFRGKGFLGDKVAAFCVLWLKDVTDGEDEELELPIWKGDYERAVVNCLDECGERIGSLKIKITFWAGMGQAHAKWASRNQHTRDVIEVIEMARDNLDQSKVEKQAGVVDEDDASSNSDSSDEDSEEKNGEEGQEGQEGKDGKEVPDGSAKHKQGVIDQLRSYKRRDKALHRQHRGLMQWKIPRTARWVKHKVGQVEEGVSGLFEHRSNQPGIETEV